MVNLVLISQGLFSNVEGGLGLEAVGNFHCQSKFSSKNDKDIQSQIHEIFIFHI